MWSCLSIASNTIKLKALPLRKIFLDAKESFHCRAKNKCKDKYICLQKKTRVNKNKNQEVIQNFCHNDVFMVHSFYGGLRNYRSSSTHGQKKVEYYGRKADKSSSPLENEAGSLLRMPINFR